MPATLVCGCLSTGRQVNVTWAPRHTSARPCRRLRGAVRAQQDDHGDAASRLQDVAAMHEALQIYQQAQEMAQHQVLQELMQMEISDMAYYKEDLPGSLQPSTPTQTHAHNSAASTKGSSSKAGSTVARPLPGSVRREPVGPAAVKPLQSFWLEQGLKAQVAHSIAQEMVASGSPFCDITRLTAQVQRLGRVIPGRVQDMVARDWKILDATPSTVAQHYVQLVQLFPNTMDVSELACRQPRLLYCDDLVGQFDAVVNKLTQLHPSHSKEEARSMLAEYPDLLFRMPYYMHARTLDELPMELQNMMVYTGQGLHHLHQLYSDSISPRFL